MKPTNKWTQFDVKVTVKLKVSVLAGDADHASEKALECVEYHLPSALEVSKLQMEPQLVSASVAPPAEKTS